MGPALTPKTPGRALAWLSAIASLLLLSAGLVTPALAHEVRPALVQITNLKSGGYDVVWKQPVIGDMAIRLVPHLSGGSLEGPVTTESVTPGFRIKTWQVRKGAPLDGQVLRIEGLSQSVTDVLVRVSTEGQEINGVIRPSNPEMTLTLSGPKGVSVPAYLRLGIEHILTGFDHLMFVLALLLLVGPNWQILKSVSAFTVAHSITLAFAALGVIRFPSAMIETLVALSIVFVACELLPRPGRENTLTRRFPWVIAFVFGLLHGFAFAGALAQIGLPQGAAPQALLLFNVGVEIGQLIFIGGAVSVIIALKAVSGRFPDRALALARATPAYVIGACATYWFIERLVAAMA